MNIGVVNVNSLRNKLFYMSNFIKDNKILALGICETWLTCHTPSSFIAIDGFNFFRKDVEGEVRKHGVGLYLEKNLDAVEDDVSVANLLSVYVKTWDIHIIICYRPPSNSEQENVQLQNFIEGFVLTRRVVLMGDFNLPTLKWPEEGFETDYVSPLDQAFVDLFARCGLTQTVHEPTYIPSGNLLDLVLTSEAEAIGEVTVAAPFPHCHHSPVLVVLHVGEGNHIRKELRLWFKGRYREIREELAMIDWRSMFERISVDECYNAFCDIISGLVERYVPVTDEKPRNATWMQKPPRQTVMAKSRAWDEYKRARKSHGRLSELATRAWEAFTQASSTLRSHAIRQQCNYEENLIDSIKDNPKLFHGYIRRKKKGRVPVGPLKVDGNVISNVPEVVEVLADSFASVFDDKLPDDVYPHQRFEGLMDTLVVSYNEVYELLLNMDPTSSPGLDEIHPQLLKTCAAELALPLTIIFQRSLASGSIPNAWRKSLITPIHKAGSRSIPLNYRPVSLTCVPCKVMERLVVKHITDYAEQNHLFSDFQFGFRAGHSTEDQLLLMYGKVSQWVDAGEAVDIVYLDFSKAFDLVCHALSLDKLVLLGFSEGLVAWVRAFLTERSLSVVVEGVRSTERHVGSGVPQGSVLGPVPFLLYVNQIARNSDSFWVAFADDFKLGIAHKRGNEGEDNRMRLQQDLNRMVEASRSWNLKLNGDKCVVMRFGGGSDGEANRPNYKIDGRDLRVVKSYRDLGVIVDDKLRFHLHVGVVVGKAGALMGDLLRSTVCRTRRFMVTLFVTHIRPFIDYCSAVWNVGYLGDIRRLEAVQRRWTREIDGVGDKEYRQRLKDLGLYSVAGRLLRADLIKIWKLLKIRRHENLLELFHMTRMGNARGHTLRLIMPPCRTDILRRTLMSRRVHTWNSLETSVVEVEGLESFKRGLDRTMRDQFYKVI